MGDVILVTGSSSGLGHCLALGLAEQNHRVYASMRNLEKRDQLEEDCRTRGVSLTVIHLDVQDPASLQGALDEILRREGRIDALINNAGAGFIRTTEEASEEEIQWILDVNFMGVVRCTRAVLPHMRRARKGRIVNISSVGGLVGQPFNEIYCAAKFAVEGFTESLASYVQPAFGIRFTAVEPGGITTEFAASVLEQFQSSGGVRDAEYQALLQDYIEGAQARSEDSQEVYQSPEQVAAVVIQCLRDPNPPIRLRTSDWAEEFCRIKTAEDPTGKLQQAKVVRKFLPSLVDRVVEI